jgi:phage baseplate assembly protein W
MSSNAKLYDKISIPAVRVNQAVTSKIYNGFSTVNTNAENFSLYDYELIKQDLLNHFYTRQGERLMNPSFGTIIWDLLFEPMTDQTKALILQNVNDIINYDPRITASDVVVTAYESGIQIECLLTYSIYNMTQALRLQFDQANGLLLQ